jgi:hypothetical protein
MMTSMLQKLVLTSALVLALSGAALINAQTPGSLDSSFDAGSIELAGVCCSGVEAVVPLVRRQAAHRWTIHQCSGRGAKQNRAS